MSDLSLQLQQAASQLPVSSYFSEALFQRLKKVAVQDPQPEVHIRGDEKSRYESIGRVVFACQRAAIAKISFVTEPPPKG